MSATDVVSVEVPDIGDFDDVPVIEILVSPGDTVPLEDPLVTLESDKATMDVPAPFAGVVKEISVKVGDRVSQGALLLTHRAGRRLVRHRRLPRGAAADGAPSEAAARRCGQQRAAAEPRPHRPRRAAALRAAGAAAGRQRRRPGLRQPVGAPRSPASWASTCTR